MGLFDIKEIPFPVSMRSACTLVVSWGLGHCSQLSTDIQCRYSINYNCFVIAEPDVLYTVEIGKDFVENCYNVRHCYKRSYLCTLFLCSFRIKVSKWMYFRVLKQNPLKKKVKMREVENINQMIELIDMI